LAVRLRTLVTHNPSHLKPAHPNPSPFIQVTHKTSWGELCETSDWLKPGPLTVGVTSGASTPDKDVEQVLEAIFRIKDLTVAGVAEKAVGLPERPSEPVEV